MHHPESLGRMARARLDELAADRPRRRRRTRPGGPADDGPPRPRYLR